MAQHPPVGQGHLIVEASRSHSDTPQSVRLPWTSDRPDAETLITNIRKRQTSMLPAGFEPSKQASAAPRFRPRGHWGRPKNVTADKNLSLPNK